MPLILYALLFENLFNRQNWRCFCTFPLFEGCSHLCIFWLTNMCNLMSIFFLLQSKINFLFFGVFIIVYVISFSLLLILFTIENGTLALLRANTSGRPINKADAKLVPSATKPSISTTSYGS